MLGFDFSPEKSLKWKNNQISNTFFFIFFYYLKKKNVTFVRVSINATWSYVGPSLFLERLPPPPFYRCIVVIVVVIVNVFVPNASPLPVLT